MKKNRRTFLFALAPCVFLGLGMLGNACSQKDGNDAALYAAYMAMLASSTATNTSTASTGTGTTTDTSVVTNTAVTISTSTTITTATN